MDDEDGRMLNIEKYNFLQSGKSIEEWHRHCLQNLEGRLSSTSECMRLTALRCRALVRGGCASEEEMKELLDKWHMRQSLFMTWNLDIHHRFQGL